MRVRSRYLFEIKHNFRRWRRTPNWHRFGDDRLWHRNGVTPASRWLLLWREQPGRPTPRQRNLTARTPREPIPDQKDNPKDGVRIVISLRGIGEGHVSSVTFRTGSWVPGAAPTIDAPSGHAATPIVERGGEDDDAPVTLRWDGIENVSEAVLFPVLSRHNQGLEAAAGITEIFDDFTLVE